ncbi:hypothetical protein BGZ65_000169, partial [Modicella reniformis]
MSQDSSASQPLLGSHHLHLPHRHNQPDTIEFGYTVQDLAPLTDPTSPKLPRDYDGGIDKICQGLRVDPKFGLHSDEVGQHSVGRSDRPKFEARSNHFGRN